MSRLPFPAARASRAERLLARVFLLFLTVAGSAVVAHFAYGFWRQRHPRLQQATLIGDRCEPYVMFSGTRDRFPDEPKPPGERRVFLLGGSAVYNGDPTIAQILERQLHDSGRSDARVFNGGVIGQVSSQEVVQVLCQVVERSPDLVILFDGGNDLLSPLSLDPRPGFPANFLLHERNPLLAENAHSPIGWWCLARRSDLVRDVLGSEFDDRWLGFSRLRHEMGVGSEPWYRLIAETYATNVWKANRLARAFDAEFLAAFQPLVYFKEPRVGREQELLSSVDPVWVERSFRQPRERIRHRLQEIAAREPLHFVDLADEFDGVERSVFYDPIHIQQDSMATVADALLREIDTRDLLPAQEAESTQGRNGAKPQSP